MDTYQYQKLKAVLVIEDKLEKRAVHLDKNIYSIERAGKNSIFILLLFHVFR